MALSVLGAIQVRHTQHSERNLSNSPVFMHPQVQTVPVALDDIAATKGKVLDGVSGLREG